MLSRRHAFRFLNLLLCLVLSGSKVRGQAADTLRPELPVLADLPDLPEAGRQTVRRPLRLDVSGGSHSGFDMGLAEWRLREDPTPTYRFYSPLDGEAERASPAQFELAPIVPFLANLRHQAAGAAPLPKDEIEHYHWKGLLWQSFFFFGAENGFRLMNDPYLRYLTAEKPFWHDYGASLKQWNLRRWSDGDSFLVAYIGHPLQGSVTEFIEIQNDPRGRKLEISGDPEYWKSLFRSFLWATAYSTDQKVGPLGETALGSEGGYTYPLHCVFPCPGYTPGVTKVTNNTGWVKLVTTPVVGTLWTLAEAFLDRNVSDRVQGDDRKRLLPKILRGSLNPAHTAANLSRGRSPWYRDFQHPEDPESSKIHFEPDDAEGMPRLLRHEVFPHFNALSLPVNTTVGCTPCRRITTGFGVGFTYGTSRWWEFQGDVNYHPNASPLPSDRAGGDMVTGTFGVGYGFRTPHYGLMASVRPGFVSYSRAYLTSPTNTVPEPQTGRITHFAASLAVTADYGITRHLAMRFSVGNTAVRYNTYRLDRAPGIGHEPYLFWTSPLIYLTNENWTYQTGPVLRF